VAKRLYEVIYGSVETRYLSAIQLSELLTLARSRNTGLDVTGVLLHQRGVFIQVLEGDEPVVGALYDRIARDPRHKNVAVFRRGPIQARQFAAWSMGFLELDASVLSRLGGWNPLLQKGAATTAPNAERLRTVLAGYR
jgi:FAD-dependent sensor of blue light